MLVNRELGNSYYIGFGKMSKTLLKTSKKNRLLDRLKVKLKKKSLRFKMTCTHLFL